MGKLYYKLGLEDYLTINARIDKKEFIKRLKDIVDTPFHIHERKEKRLYEGEVLENEFTFRRKKGFLGFDNDSETLVKVNGTIKEDNGLLIINAKIVGQTREAILSWGLIGSILFTISFIINSDQFRWDVFLLLVGTLIFIILFRYSNIQKGISKMRRTVDLELNNLVKQNEPQHRV